MKKLDLTYHSAYNEEENLESIERFENEMIVALRHDVRQPLPEEFNSCDLLYTEPPWKAGFERFNKRAGVSGGTFRDLMLTLAGVLYEAPVPAVMVCSPTVLNELPTRTDEMPVLLNGAADARMCGWGLSFETLRENGVRTQIDALTLFAEEYSKVGDPMCGYGDAGKVFAAAGKGSVLSDYNGKCIAYIRDHYPDWVK